ncbi:uncharacterized protein B0T23DRAFT_405058 [Neurospora hispaniola]|uniref:Uncharacterized protein n=1 Tax=Neurospora hispaniola TaxID=588809 RepID=A0AAJ0I505_9PEZI|nr:hypothetical protein B0T23DRAFT_405058 [Neurospora hispaniola]
MSWRPPPMSSTARLIVPLRTPIHTSDDACNNAAVQLPAFCQHTGLQVYAYATNSDAPSPLATAVNVRLSSIPVEDEGWSRYVVLNGLTLPRTGRWRVFLYGVVPLHRKVWQPKGDGTWTLNSTPFPLDVGV